MALWSVAMIGSTPIGGPIVGFVGEHIGARWGLVIGGVCAIATAAYAHLRLFKEDTAHEINVRPEDEEIELGVERLKVR
jgi:hypothetical protein